MIAGRIWPWRCGSLILGVLLRQPFLWITLMVERSVPMMDQGTSTYLSPLFFKFPNQTWYNLGGCTGQRAKFPQTYQKEKAFVDFICECIHLLGLKQRCIVRKALQYHHASEDRCMSPGFPLLKSMTHCSSNDDGIISKFNDSIGEVHSVWWWV